MRNELRARDEETPDNTSCKVEVKMVEGDMEEEKKMVEDTNDDFTV